MDNSGDESEKSTNNQSDSYVSSELLLEYISKEYDKEDERSKNIDSRISIFITISTFFLGYMFGGANKDIVFKEMSYKEHTVYVAIFILCILSVFASIGLFIWIMGSKEYRRIRIEHFDNVQLNKANKGKASYELILGYKEALQNNIKINDVKTKVYMTGIILLIVSVIFFMLLKIFIFIFI